MVTASDFDGDGDVDGNDYLLWQVGIKKRAGTSLPLVRVRTRAEVSTTRSIRLYEVMVSGVVRQRYCSPPQTYKDAA